MNKRILISLSIIGVVAAVIVGGTIAFFSDTETSTGNTFTAGSIDLTIDNECYYNYMRCVCEGEECYWWEWGEAEPTDEPCSCTWELDDLDGKLFFNFTDLKPGDWGEDTISIHVDNNDAWACVAVMPTENDDNGCTEPEEEAEGDGVCENGVPAAEWDGDLAQELYFGFWADIAVAGVGPCEGAYPGDNIFQECCGDIPLMYGPASDTIGGVVYTLADADENNVGGNPGDPLVGGDDYYIGKAWCFGDWDWGNGFVCDGSQVGNESQSDSLMGDITFYAVQARNNPNFQCGVDWPL